MRLTKFFGTPAAVQSFQVSRSGLARICLRCDQLAWFLHGSFGLHVEMVWNWGWCWCAVGYSNYFFSHKYISSTAQPSAHTAPTPHITLPEHPIHSRSLNPSKLTIYCASTPTPNPHQISNGPNQIGLILSMLLKHPPGIPKRSNQLLKILELKFFQGQAYISLVFHSLFVLQ